MLSRRELPYVSQICFAAGIADKRHLRSVRAVAQGIEPLKIPNGAGAVPPAVGVVGVEEFVH